ncbi:MAG: electron transfer flavoprotein subunit beta/FixA family protein [bacterium]|nr:electron transfer flavoprotein subunit beta/FixA family protein [bacterium]
MKIIVGIKHVPDTEAKVKVASDGSSLDEAAVNKWVISPYDEYALEQALQLRDAAGEGEVVAVCAGPASAQATLRQGLAMGADRGVHVSDDGFGNCDGLTRARALATICEAEGANLVLLGKYGVGTDEGQTAAMLGEVLGWPHAGGVSACRIEGEAFHVERAVEGAVEVQQGTLPAVISCDKGLNEPRYPSLKGIMQAKKKPLETKTPADLGLDMDRPMLVWESMELPPPRESGQMIEGEAGAAAAELVRILHEKEKVL